MYPVSTNSCFEHVCCHSNIAGAAVFARYVVDDVVLVFMGNGIFNICEQLSNCFDVAVCKSYVFLIVFQVLVDSVRQVWYVWY